MTALTRDLRMFDTPFGLGELIVGVAAGPSAVSDGEHLVVKATPNAAQELARLIAQGVTALRDNDPGDVDTTTWMHVVVDLLCSAAMCGPNPDPVYASGYLPPKGNRQ